MNELEEFNNEMIKAEITDAEKVMSEILAPVDNGDLAVIPEPIFVEYFLDYFRDPNKDLNSPILHKWYEIAQGQYNEVGVVDQTGSIIYKVPSVYPKVEITNDLNKLNFSQLATEYTLESNRTVEAGNKLISRALNGLDKKIDIKTQENIEAWMAVFARYDTPKKPTTTNTKVMPNDDINDFLNY